MKRILYISCFVLALSACNSSPKATQNVITPTPEGLNSAPAQTVSTGERPTHNPEHGQPYHDCALPVGAPFNTKQVAPVTTVPTETPQNNTPAPATPPVSATQKEARLNPAHGQPGHTCDLPVGAPLT